MRHRIIVHYDEIAIKGKNRNYFEKALVQRIRTALGELCREVQKKYGRIVCIPAPEADTEELCARLARLPGIVHFSVGVVVEREVEQMKEVALELLEGLDFDTFGVKTKRSDKNFPLNSSEISAQVGGFLKARLEKKVDLSRPDLRLFIELTHTEAFLYSEKIKGPGGLPTGTSGKVLCSLSGGLDSPVAAYMMMKRGCAVNFVHIRNETQFAEDALGKIEELVTRLTRHQLRSKLYVIPFGELQRAIIAFVPAKYRMIVYRRFMMRILNRLAPKERAGGIVTGDSVGQVASQTLENIRCIQAAAELPVLAPLTGLNKEEIVTIARRIGTYDPSTLPYPDCCSFMIAPHPETGADLAEIEGYEAGIEDAEALVERAVTEAQVKTFTYPA